MTKNKRISKKITGAGPAGPDQTSHPKKGFADKFREENNAGNSEVYLYDHTISMRIQLNSKNC
jgi:hypothetical protein